jgi:hypothetical protein
VQFGKAWSLNDRTKEAIKEVSGHNAQKKSIAGLAHLCGTCREHGGSPEVKAFLVQLYKASVDSFQNNGKWGLAWNLLCIPDPEEQGVPVTAPAERVARVALPKRRRSWRKGGRRRRRMHPPSDLEGLGCWRRRTRWVANTFIGN